MRASFPPEAINGPSILIDADADTPSDQQRDLYRSLQQNLEDLSSAGTKYIRQQAPPYSSRQFEIYAIEIPSDAEISRNQFVLEFSSDPDASIIHRIGFVDGVPASYCEDC